MKSQCISQLFTELFKEKLKKGIRAVLSDYNLYQHAKLLGFKPQPHMKESANRVVIFYSETSLIFIVRVASSLDCIIQESQNISADVKYFVSVNKPLIIDTTLTVIGVVACLSVERKDLKEKLNLQFSCNFKFHNLLFICKDELESVKTLYKWWDKKICKYSMKYHKAKNEPLSKKPIS